MRVPSVRSPIVAVGLALLSLLVTSAQVRNPSAGFMPPSNAWGYNLQPWDDMNGAGWSWARRQSSQDPSIVSDPTAPASPTNVLQMVFTPDMPFGTEPSVHWIELSAVTEVYQAWWFKLSTNWTCVLNEWCTHLTYLFAQNTDGQLYTALFHPSGEQAGPPYRVGANTEWAPYITNRLLPNVETTWVNPGEWHWIEFYSKWETRPGAGDGIIRWQVDGVLNGNYTDVHYPETRGFIEYQMAPTFGTPPETQYMWVDHTLLRYAVPRQR